MTFYRVVFHRPQADHQRIIASVLYISICGFLFLFLQYAKAIKDDNLCIGIEASKHIDMQRPRVEYSLVETEPRLAL